MRRDKDRLRRAWGISAWRGVTLEEDLLIFLGDLCKNGGFCNAGPSEVMTFGQPLTAEDFACSVLVAEGWSDPDSEYEYRPQLVRLFTERYGPAVSADDYRSNEVG